MANLAKNIGLAILVGSSTAPQSSWANHLPRDYSQVQVTMSEAAQYDGSLPNATPSERAHQSRMKSYVENKALSALKELTFVPQADPLDTIRAVKDLSQSAAQFLYPRGRQEVERVMLATVGKDVKADIVQKSMRQAEFSLEDFAARESRAWNNSLEKAVFSSAVQAVGQVLESRVSGGLCQQSTQDLASQRAEFDRLARDPSIASSARTEYDRLAGIVNREIVRRTPPSVDPNNPNPPPPAPLPNCIPTLGLRDGRSRDSIDPSLGIFASRADRIDLQADSFGLGNVDQVIAAVDPAAQHLISTWSGGRDRVRLEIRQMPKQETIVMVRVSALDMNRNILADVIFPVVLAGDCAQALLPAAPTAQSVNLVAEMGGRSVTLENGGSLSMIKGSRASLKGDVLDQYGYSMGIAPAQLSVATNPANKIGLEFPLNGGPGFVVALNVSDDRTPAQVAYVVTPNLGGIVPVRDPVPDRTIRRLDGGGVATPIRGIGPIGGPVPIIRGTFYVNTGFDQFRGFSLEEATSLTDRLYRGILQRGADYPGANGYRNDILKNGFKGLRGAAADIAKSQEFMQNIQYRQTPQQIVEALYQGLLGRGVDPTGAQSAIPMIAARRTHDVASSLVNSTEFRNSIIGR